MRELISRSSRLQPAWAVLAGWLLLGLGPDPAMATESAPGLLEVPLEQELGELLADPSLDGAVVSARVDDLASGRTLFSHQPDQLVNPASVSKMFTTAAALCLLHPEYRFRTEVLARQKIERGVLKGPLWIRGGGDPSLVSERLSYLVQELYALGLRKVEGPIILDDTAFVEERPPGFSQDSSSDPYQAPPAALGFNFNSVSVLVYPGEQAGEKPRIELLPASDAFEIESEVKTIRRGTRVRARVAPAGRKTRIALRGFIGEAHPGLRLMVRVENPTFYFGETLRAEMKLRGIQVRGDLRRGKTPEDAETLLVFSSPELAELIRTVNKRSQNFMSEQMYLTLGAELLGPPASYVRGERALGAFLAEEVGIPTGSYVLHNGSGLNDTNRVSASQVVRLLRYMAGRVELRPDFEASLAIGGADGTVAGRFADPAVSRTLRVKTGSLRNVRALAGYVLTRSGQTLAFAILISRFGCPSDRVLSIIDRFATALSLTNGAGSVVRSARVSLEPDPRASSAIGARP